MKLKPKWPFFTAFLGILGILTGVWWILMSNIRYRANIGAGGIEYDEWMPWHLQLAYFIGIALLLFSIVELSDAKWLRRISRTIAAVMVISAVCLFAFFDPHHVISAGWLIAWSVILLGIPLLGVAALISIAIFIASWLRKRRENKIVYSPRS